MIGEVRGKSLMIGIELIRNQNRIPGNTEGNKIRDFCLGKGLLIGMGGSYGNVFRIQPPIIISPKQLDQAVKILDRAF